MAAITTSPSEIQSARLTDSHGRVIQDLRVSITDRCNYKCVYCRTGEHGAQYPELGIDEYLRLIRLFVEPNRFGTTVMIATHDRALIESTRAREIRLIDGRLIEMRGAP